MKLTEKKKTNKDFKKFYFFLCVFTITEKTYFNIYKFFIIIKRFKLNFKNCF